MNAWNISALCTPTFIGFVLLFYFLQTDCNMIGEWQFQNLHDNLDKLHWKQLEKLTEKDLKRICTEVLNGMTIPSLLPLEDYSRDEEDNSTMKSATVLENCKVSFRHDVVPMSLIKCDDKRLTFYLADADDHHIFVLRLNKDGSYSFTGDKRNVTYNLPG